jgi:Tol biopolymer transport system component
LLAARVAPHELILLALLAALTTTALMALPASAKVPGPNGQILFTRFDPTVGDGVLYTINPDGTGLRAVLPGVGIECPNWSPDGSRIATCGSPDGAASRIINPDTGTYREVFAADPSLNLACSVWSPDASRLACDQYAVPDNPNRAGLYTIRSSDGGGIQRITSNPGGEDTPVDYSPDGSQIAFIRTDPSRPPQTSRAIFVVHLDGSGLHRISPWSSRGLGMNAGWSPGGTTIAFSNQGSLYRVNPDGSGLKQIPLQGILTKSFAFDPDWSPDGTKIVFGMYTGATPATSQEGIYTANADGSDVTHLTRTPTHDDSEDWGPHPLNTTG